MSDAPLEGEPLKGESPETTVSRRQGAVESTDGVRSHVQGGDGGGAQRVDASDGAGEGEDESGDDDEDDEDEDEDEDEEDDDDDEEEEEEDDEPRLKYDRLTQHLGSVYKNGDSTSSFLVAGDKMIIGTHSGNIHVIQLPSFQTLLAYHAHTVSVTSISISPFPPPVSILRPDALLKAAASQKDADATRRPGSKHAEGSPAAAFRKPREAPTVPNMPSNQIYIATSSMDGNVCVQSLMERRDVQLRNFARPVQAVALSPEYKSDRTYLSGGLAGNLILTVGGQAGRSTSTTIGTAAATASSWLGSIGLAGNSGKDTILHSGEGTISTIKWSLSGKYVVWLNEHGIKIMRTKLKLESADAEDAWKRIGHIDRPQTAEWDAMATAWKGRAEWIDEQAVEQDDDDGTGILGGDSQSDPALVGVLSPATEKLKQQQSRHDKTIEKLVVGWGGTIWIIHVHPGGMGVGQHAGEKSVGRAEIHQKLRMDCIISGVSLYTQSLLMVLAYCLPDEEDDDDDEEEEEEEEEEKGDPKKTNQSKGHRSRPSNASKSSEPSGGIRRKQDKQPPELRLIDLKSQSEIYKDGLSVSRYEGLSAGDYHLGVLPARNQAAVASSKSALEALAGFGTDMWNAAINPKILFNSAASVRSGHSNDGASNSKLSVVGGSTRTPFKVQTQAAHPHLETPGPKIFIHSPYDCILSTKRDLGDHLMWLLEHHEYQAAWELLDEHPEIAATSMSVTESSSALTPTAERSTQSSQEFFDEGASTIDAGSRAFNSSVEREKRRIGELWMQDLVEEGDWVKAGQVASKVLGDSHRWEKWIWTFAGASKFDEMVDYIPTKPMRPPIDRSVYEVVLGHYLKDDKVRFRELLDRWPVELFDANTIATTLENQLKYRDVREDSVEDGERGRDWRIVMESLARLHEANGRLREALKCHIRLQDAENAFRLIREGHLAEAVVDDVPSFILLRVRAGMEAKMSLEELEVATSEAITLLVDEAQNGLVKPETVVSQLKDREDLHPYLFFYIRGLWTGQGVTPQRQEGVAEARERMRDDSRSLVDDFADLAVQMFATYDRTLLKEFLEHSLSYSFEKAEKVCEEHSFIPELVYLYAKTGQMKRALYLIIDRLGDVSRAIEFAKTQDDPDLWEDLLNYSMDKPRFIRALLEEVGTAIDPITLVRRIPEGLEIPGLREGLTHIMKEHEIQHSISSGVARVLRSEVAAAQATLRSGQRRGVKFEIAPLDQTQTGNGGSDLADAASAALDKALESAAGGPGASTTEGKAPVEEAATVKSTAAGQAPKPGHCAGCLEAFTVWEMETLVGFACGHVFHLSHLLEALHPGRTISDGPDLNGDTFRAGETMGGRLHVRSKVTHARLLKDRIQGGCPVCPKKTGVGPG